MPSAPAGPAGPVAPVAPIAPCGPAGPVAPTAPLGPAAPTAPGAPAGPAAPVSPRAPWGPAAPGSPFAPAGPCGPGLPAAVLVRFFFGAAALAAASRLLRSPASAASAPTNAAKASVASASRHAGLKTRRSGVERDAIHCHGRPPRAACLTIRPPERTLAQGDKMSERQPAAGRHRALPLLHERQLQRPGLARREGGDGHAGEPRLGRHDAGSVVRFHRSQRRQTMATTAVASRAVLTRLSSVTPVVICSPPSASPGRRAS